MSQTTETIIDEVGELFTTLLATSPDQLTNCPDWTAHDLTAHLAAGAGEEAELIEAHLAGEAERATRAFAEREAPYRALPDAVLRDQLVQNSARLSTALHELERADGEPVLFTGRPMTAADFAMHSRSECAVHRWDLVGRDDIGWRMLAQPELTKHALTVLMSMSTLPEAPPNRIASARLFPPTRLVLRSEPQDDVVITVSGGAVSMVLESPRAHLPDVELDPAARLLVLWGRREPSAPVTLHASGDERTLANLLLGL
jgi:uncharacterized protein (TIGR03083 family)